MYASFELMNQHCPEDSNSVRQHILDKQRKTVQ